MEGQVFIHKICLVGDRNSGVESLVHRLMNWPGGSTIGCGDAIRKYKIGAEFVVKVLFYRTPHRFDAIRRVFWKGASGLILVIDMTQSDTLARIPIWIEQADLMLGTRVPIILACNKCDLPIRVDMSELAKTAGESGIPFLLTSANTGQNVEELFQSIAVFTFMEGHERLQRNEPPIKT